MVQTAQEWLVTDQRGCFALGTADGIRTRKYHGFFMGIPSRAETAFLVDLEIEVNGISLWPHSYASYSGEQVIHPVPKAIPREFSQAFGPRWSWKLKEGQLVFSLQANTPGGIKLSWNWTPKARRGSKKPEPVILKIRPLFAMRPLHAVGGQTWVWESQEGSPVVRVAGPTEPEVYLKLSKAFRWVESPLWYYQFFYPEEQNRGYDSREDLYSAGELMAELDGPQTLDWILSSDASDLEVSENLTSEISSSRQSRVQDFLLKQPAGVVAGFPWFGEWGRDTFVSLPGLIAGWLRSQPEPSVVWEWTQELLARWGEFIHEVGMLPNLIEREGTHQWESADATLWWIHALAGLWQLSLQEEYSFLDQIRPRFRGLLDEAIRSIESGKHLFLHLDPSDGLLEVRGAHSTWMDARIQGAPVTPRSGKLPEINALWFQARCLQLLWSEQDPIQKENRFAALAELGSELLRKCDENVRSNRVFLHSIPLAPSFVLGDQDQLNMDLALLEQEFWTPVGLRTLSPKSAGYLVHCCGGQIERDQSYHQGPAWGWLGGHYLMAKARSKAGLGEERMFNSAVLSQMPITGHIAELFDAEAPFSPRGAPAQAWSLACLDEALTRRKLKLDVKLKKQLPKKGIPSRKGQSARKPVIEAGI